jgi:DNA-binding NarL/FixJ family response regulator
MTPRVEGNPTVGSVMKAPIRLLLVDDEARVRKGLRMCIAGEEDLELVGEATDCAAALTLSAALKPDVMVLDLKLTGMHGLAAAKALRQTQPSMGVVILSLEDDAQTREDALRAGATAFVAKQEGVGKLFEVIRAVARSLPRQS